MCDLKNGNSRHLTVYPMMASSAFESDPKNKERADCLFESVNKMRYKTSGHLRKYIDSTEKYLRKVQKNDTD